MTTGATLYLVSACGSAEEFVAAFRRYADRTGLFVPSTAPLPAGRRGRLALTLKDGGVMIEGEAEVVQSSTRPTVLYGRPGMTIKFVAPDELSKVVIGELEKARLALKPAPSRVPPRPAVIPPEPRPVVPPVGGRVDAVNALAESVVVGDTSVLADTSAPKPVGDGGSGKAKFVVPAIGPGGARPKSPTTPPAARPKSPTTPPAARPKSPTAPPDPTSKPLPQPAPGSRMTSIGFPAIDKLPAFPAKAPPPDSPLLTTMPDTGGARKPAPAPVTARSGNEEATSIGEVPTAIGQPPTKPPAAPAAAVAVATDEPTSIGEAPPTASGIDEATSIGEVPPQPAAAAIVVPDEPTTIGEPPAKPTTHPMPTAAPAPAPRAASPSKPPPHSASGKHKATSIGFPVMRVPMQTQPFGLVPPAASAEPSPPVVPKSDGARSSNPPPARGKSATRPPLVPRQPTPVAPVPIVRSPAKVAPIVEDEQTEISSGPPQPPTAPAPSAPASASLAPAASDAAAEKPQRSGGMRASEILAAIPADDWTMTPDAAVPTIVPSTGGPKPAAAEADDTAAKGPPTGNWTISLDPETGWSEPAKVETPAPPAAPASPPARERKVSSGNPVVAVASDKPIQAVRWEDKPTSLGEAKIEIDPTLMEPLGTPPSLDDNEDQPAQAITGGRAGTEPLTSVAVLRPPAPSGSGSVPPPLVGSKPPGTDVEPTAPSPFAAPPGPSPFAAPAAPSPFAAPAAPSPFAAPPVSPLAAPDASASPFAAPPAADAPPPPPAAPATSPHAAAFDASAQAAMFGFGPRESKPGIDAFGTFADDRADRRRKRKLIIGATAVAAVTAGFVLVLLLQGGTSSPPPKANTAGESGSAALQGSAAIPTPTPAGSAGADGSADVADDVVADDGAGSAVAAVTPAAQPDAGVVEETPAPAVDTADTCKVTVRSVPAGAAIIVAKAKRGITPEVLELPCGKPTALTLRKATFNTADRKVTPKAGKPTKVVVKLTKPTFTLRVTSTPMGATIMSKGRAVGVTPTKIRLPGYRATSITLTKPGYAPSNRTVTLKNNKTSQHVTLTKRRR